MVNYLKDSFTLFKYLHTRIYVYIYIYLNITNNIFAVFKLVS